MTAPFDFKNPDYTEVIRWRAETLAKLKADPKLLAASKIHYKHHPWDFITDWGWTFDPRNIEIGRQPAVPFVLWPRQFEYLEWIHARWLAQEGGLVEKSRDCGVTSLSAAYVNTMFLFWDGYTAGFGSRKEELVDKLGDTKTIFHKVRYFLETIPAIFLPEGWDPKKHCNYMRITNPANGATITGEAGDDIGRGGRTSVYFVDEAAAIEHQQEVDNALSMNTNCQIDISTPRGSGNLFYQKRQRVNNTPRLFVFDWRAQPLDAKILTPNGWVQMGEVQVEASVIGGDGLPIKVEGVYPQGAKAVYRVGFSDGTSTECCADHLWDVIPYGNQRKERRHITRTLPLHKIAEDFRRFDKRGFKSHRYQIPMTKAVQFQPQVLPVHPYVMGVLLGDGSLPTKDQTAIFLSIGPEDTEIISLLNARLPPRCKAKQANGIQYWISANSAYRGGKGRGCHNPVNEAIRKLGLSGAKSHTKFIPQSYLLATPKDRLALLQGLLDADGYAPKRHPGAALLSTTSQSLADGAAFLAQSLGGTAKIRRFKPDPIAVFENGRQCKRREYAFTVTICLPGGMVPFLVGRKAKAYKPATRFQPRRSITSIDLVGKKECQCIKVASIDGRYLTDNCVVTHNSDPRKDEDWYQRQKAKHTTVTVAQEIDRDYEASQEDSFIPAMWIRACIDAHLKLGFPAAGVRVAAFDPADTGDAKALGKRYGSVLIDADQKTSGDITQAAPWALSEADEWRADVFVYDADGMGAPSMKLVLQRFPALRMEVLPYHGSAGVQDNDLHQKQRGKDFRAGKDLLRSDFEKPAKDMFENFRAQTWYWLRVRFELTAEAIERAAAGQVVNLDPGYFISISSKCKKLNELVSELSRPQRKYTPNGRILVESKKDMKARGVESPNLADMMVMAFSVTAIPLVTAKKKVRPPLEFESYGQAVRGVM